MKRVHHVPAIGVLLLVLPAVHVASAAEQGRYGISWTTLANGMDVVVVENHAVPLVTIEIVVKNGAYTEPPELDGLSHLYEHMFFKGNASIPNQERYMARLRELGAQWNGTTSDERVNYFMTVEKANLREGAIFLRDALRYPLFNEAELRRERPVVLGEFDRNEANPGFHLFREVNRRLWYQHFSRKNTIGDRDVILTATREQMREIQRRYYVPNNSALFVGGDVTPAEVFDMAADLFGDWSRSDNPHERWPVPAHPPLTQTSRLAVVGNVRTAQVQLSWHGPGLKADTPATYAADVFSFILGQPDSSFQKALVDTGLVDNVSLGYYSLVHTGPITLFASTSADRVDQAWAAIEAEVAKFDDPAYIADEQIEAAKNQLEISEIYGREQTTQFVHTVSFWWAGAGLDYYVDYVDNLRNVTRADIARYVRAYIKGQPRVEAALVAEADVPRLAFARTAEVVRPTSGSSATAFEGDPPATQVTTEEIDVDGLAVILRRTPGSEVVVAETALAGGLPFYGPRNAGRELLLLELLDKGSQRYPKDEVNRVLARTGATLYQAARHDYSTFGLRTLRRDLDTTFSIFADALAHPLLDTKEFELALERRRNDIRSQIEVPDAYIPILASRNFYRGHPYEVPPAGTEETMQEVGPDDLRQRHRDTVVRARLKLFVVGDVTRDEVTRLVREGLRDLPAGTYEAKVVMRDASQPGRLLVEDRKLPTNYIFGAFEAPGLASPAYASMQVGLSILSDRLFEEVRTRRNLSYAASASISSRVSNYGALYVTPVRANEAVTVILSEVERLVREPVSEKELQDKIAGMITRDLTSRQTNRSQAANLVLYEMAGPGWEEEATAVEKLMGVTASEIQEVAGRYLKNISFSVLGDRSQIDEAVFRGR